MSNVLRCILLVAGLLCVACFSHACPTECMCANGVARCVRAGLFKIPEVPNDIYSLDLSFNMITFISPAKFSHFTNLTVLALNNNRITSLKNRTFIGLQKLEKLYLHQNAIQRLEQGAFFGLHQLKFLYLQNNHLLRIDPKSMTGLINLQKLQLDDNPIQCDCSNARLLKWFTRNADVQVSGNCKAPAELYGLAIATMTMRDLDCEAPMILEHPKDVVVEQGYVVYLTCTVSGKPKPHVIWNRNSVPIPNNERYLILTNSTLVIRRSERLDEAHYDCLAVNSVSEAKSRSAAVIVRRELQNFAPEFLDVPLNLSVLIGEEFVLSCSVDGKPKPHIRWSHNGTDIVLSDRITLLSTGSLQIYNATIEDGGTYDCQGINVRGTTTKSASVVIEAPPTFLRVPEDTARLSGDSVTFYCKVDGIPTPTIVWYKTNNLNESEKIEPSSHYLFNTESIMTIRDLVDSDTGVYTCQADNYWGTEEHSFKLNVENKNTGIPKIYEKPFNIEANIGSSIQLPCKSKGKPKPRTEWKKEGARIIPNARVKMSYSGNLIIYNVSTTDGGRYECSVINDYGRDTAYSVVAVTASTLNDQYIKVAVNQAIEEIDAAINNTIDILINNTNHVDPFRLIRYPDKSARAVARSAEIYERTLHLIKKKFDQGLVVQSPTFEFKQLLSPDQINTIAELSGCTAHRIVNNCSDVCFHNKYRSIDGTCNNLIHRTWGASLTGFRRILEPIYENGLSLPVGWSKESKYNGYSLPSARQISLELISTKSITQDKRITHMVMQWGQFLDHDLDHALPSVSSQSWDGIDCKKSCDFAPPCFPMEVPPNDPRISNRRCIDFIRTSAVCGSGMTSVFFNKLQSREQINQLTSYIDGSQIYGFSNELANDLRDLNSDNGELRLGPTFVGQKPLLPFAGNQGVDCRRDLSQSNINCFLAGDIRANEQIGLTAMHTIWMREHNRLAKALKEINPFWDGETIYQEARKIVGAEIQFITYENWLPIILGPDGMKELGRYEGYDPNLNPSISNVFATAALRFGHTLINPILHRYDENFETISQGHLELHKGFFAPWRIIEEGGIDPLIRGMFITPAKLKKSDENLNDELTEKLFHTAHAVALDLAAMNIQRARDHAIPSYVEWRKFCKMSDVVTFDDLKHEIIDPKIRQKLKELYGTPQNIDVFVGGILENQVKGGKVGPLFKCLLVEQFKRLRDGDRLWYENPKIFTPQQLEQIKSTSLAHIICKNGDKIDTITEDVFILPELQDMVNCDVTPSINLNLWADCYECKHHRKTSNSPDNSIDDLEQELAEMREAYKKLELEVTNIKRSIRIN